MTTQTKADREEAAQKAAATRKRNETRDSSREAGRKAAATRQQNDAIEAAKQARKDVEQAFSSLGSAAKSTRDASVLAGRSVATRVGVGPKD
jgi:hypothetical protein